MHLCLWKKYFGKGCLVSKFQRINVFSEWWNSFVSFITSNGKHSFGLRLRRSCEVHSYPLPQQGLLETFPISLLVVTTSTWWESIGLECEIKDTFASVSQQVASIFPKKRLAPWGIPNLSWDLNSSITIPHRVTPHSHQNSQPLYSLEFSFFFLFDWWKQTPVIILTWFVELLKPQFSSPNCLSTVFLSQICFSSLSTSPLYIMIFSTTRRLLYLLQKLE